VTPEDQAEELRRHAAAEISLRTKRIRSLSEDLRGAKRELREARQQGEQAQRELAAFRRRRSVRLALMVADRLRLVTGFARRIRHTSRASEVEVTSTPGSVDRGIAGEAAGPTIFRETFLGRMAGLSQWSDAPLLVGIAGDEAAAHAPEPDAGRQLAVGLAKQGWRTTLLRRSSVGAISPATSLDVVVSMSDDLDIRRLPDGVVTVAWISARTEDWLAREWFEEYDLVLVTTEASRALIDAQTVHVAEVIPATDDLSALRVALTRWVSARRIDIAIGPPHWDVASRWGDYHYGRALQRALQRRGYPTRLRLRSAWEGPAAGRADATLQLFGLAVQPARPGQVSAIWVISHPELVTDELVRDHDVVFVASDAFAARLAQTTGRAVIPLHQATDPDRFRPVAGGPIHDLLFVANSRGARRVVVDELTPTERDLVVYGRGWTTELLDPRHFGGEHVPNDRLAAYYGGAKIVLNDHWADMAQEGFLSNRLYDAAASGAFVISDRVPGIDEEFDGGIVSFTDGDELRELVERYLDDPAGRIEHARRARTAVLARHTFTQRVEVILEALEAAWLSHTT
jgi:glycosyltransferase involved in cell wall biosynthesis